MTANGRNKSGFSKAVKVVTLALVAAAVTKELTPDHVYQLG